MSRVIKCIELTNVEISSIISLFTKIDPKKLVQLLNLKVVYFLFFMNGLNFFHTIIIVKELL
jgi:hypothetical protein